MINSDLMRDRCRIEYKVVSQDATYGTEVVTWTTLATRWGEVQDVLPSRSESVQEGLAVAKNQTRLRMLYWDDITSEMRVVVTTRSGEVIYQIISGPSIVGNKDGIEMMIERVSTI